MPDDHRSDPIYGPNFREPGSFNPTGDPVHGCGCFIVAALVIGIIILAVRCFFDRSFLVY